MSDRTIIPAEVKLNQSEYASANNFRFRDVFSVAKSSPKDILNMALPIDCNAAILYGALAGSLTLILLTKLSRHDQGSQEQKPTQPKIELPESVNMKEARKPRKGFFFRKP